ncbi:MAG TPA: chaperone NapD [Beijerinckiaceae bacterium]|jgi:nitrate reductase NapD
MSAADLPSRRELLTGRLIAPAPPETHVSSLVLHVRPDKVTAVRTALGAMDGLEIHAEASGKLVVTFETSTEADIVARMNEISLLDGVMSAALVFHHFEPAADPEPAANQG